MPLLVYLAMLMLVNFTAPVMLSQAVSELVSSLRVMWKMTMPLRLEENSGISRPRIYIKEHCYNSVLLFCNDILTIYSLCYVCKTIVVGIIDIEPAML